MKKERAYISNDLFLDCLTTHFIPRKTPGKCLLILDGYASHMSNADILQIASDSDIFLLCLTSYTTHYLQPLDRVVFKLFKTYFKDACQQLVTRRSETGRITREDFVELLQSAWSRSATVKLTSTAFQATGINPLDINAIPEHAYLLACEQNTHENAIEPTDSSILVTELSTTLAFSTPSNSKITS
ncbi:uncharacterized protein [Diabrotica undecimpunctata]|uniref:uncharacterized protein n=1 Tax=Diabrotica undecimpunctata TaxID=50387 RepID=UPI003B63CAE6